jgi:hypothetical protein
MRRRDDFFKLGSYILDDGQDVRVWEDTWLGDSQLSVQYPSLYSIVNNKNFRVADVLVNEPPKSQY